MMKNRFAFAAVAAVVAMAFAAGSYAESPMDIVLKREEAMKQLGGHMKAIKAFATEGQGSAADVAKRAAEISDIAGKIPAMFPAGTDMNGAADSKYLAKAEIWKDWAGFEKASTVLGVESKKLAAVAGGGDQAAIAAAFEQMGKEGCGGCHKTFRQKLE